MARVSPEDGPCRTCRSTKDERVHASAALARVPGGAGTAVEQAAAAICRLAAGHALCAAAEAIAATVAQAALI